MNNKLLRKLSLTTVAVTCSVAMLGLGGCAALGTAVKHGSLQTNVQMSKTIFLDPTMPVKKVAYVQLHNTTGDDNFNLQPELSQAIAADGYRITTNARTAGIILQVNLLQVGRTSKTAAEEMMNSGYGGTTEGIASGAFIAGSMGVNPVGGALGGAVATTVADNLVKDVLYSGIVDVKLTVVSRGHKKAYTTRILTTADQVNLKYQKALPAIEKQLVSSISGLLG